MRFIHCLSLKEKSHAEFFFFIFLASFLFFLLPLSSTMSTKRSALQLGKSDSGDSISAAPVPSPRTPIPSPRAPKSPRSEEEFVPPPVIFREKLDINKTKLARRLSTGNRRLSALTASQSFFPDMIRERFKIRDLLGRFEKPSTSFWETRGIGFRRR